MSDASWALQEALYSALSTALDPTPVYDHIPQDTTGDYVVIGDDTVIPNEDKTSQGQEHTVTIQAFSTYQGRKQAKALMKTVYDTLSRQRLTLTGFKASLAGFEFAESFNEPDTSMGRAIHRYRIHTNPE